MPRTLLFDRSDRTRLRFSGAPAVATLNGLVTNDVAALTPGHGAYAATLTAKGKLVADLRIFRLDDGLLVDTPALAASGLREMFTKYVNPRFATMTDLTAEMGDLGVFGDMAGQVLAHALGAPPEAIEALGDYEHRTLQVRETSVTVARVPDLGITGYDLFIPQTHVAKVRDALLATGATEADVETWHTHRVAAGRPAWAIDMDETTLPQEANFDALDGVSYTKGCYIGQETVARIHFRGHVNKNLRRLTIEGHRMPPARTELFDQDGKSVGDIRSTARYGENGQTIIGIGMVRREIEDGTPLTVRWEGGETLVHVVGSAPGNAKGAID
jgi:tRNA-modifying protein YgfZ